MLWLSTWLNESDHPGILPPKVHNQLSTMTLLGESGHSPFLLLGVQIDLAGWNSCNSYTMSNTHACMLILKNHSRDSSMWPHQSMHHYVMINKEWTKGSSTSYLDSTSVMLKPCTCTHVYTHLLTCTSKLIRSLHAVLHGLQAVTLSICMHDYTCRLIKEITRV